MLVTVSIFWNKIQAQLFHEIQQLVSDSYSDCQMSHCFLFVIIQVENNRAQAPESSNTERVFHGVHLKCLWLDALSIAKGLFVSWVQRTWQPTRALAPSLLDSGWFGLVRLEGGLRQRAILIRAVDLKARSDGDQTAHRNAAITAVTPPLEVYLH